MGTSDRTRAVVTIDYVEDDGKCTQIDWIVKKCHETNSIGLRENDLIESNFLFNNREIFFNKLNNNLGDTSKLEGTVCEVKIFKSGNTGNWRVIPESIVIHNQTSSTIDFSKSPNNFVKPTIKTVEPTKPVTTLSIAAKRSLSAKKGQNTVILKGVKNSLLTAISKEHLKTTEPEIYNMIMDLFMKIESR